MRPGVGQSNHADATRENLCRACEALERLSRSRRANRAWWRPRDRASSLPAGRIVVDHFAAQAVPLRCRQSGSGQAAMQQLTQFLQLWRPYSMAVEAVRRRRADSCGCDLRGFSPSASSAVAHFFHASRCCCLRTASLEGHHASSSFWCAEPAILRNRAVGRTRCVDNHTRVRRPAPASRRSAASTPASKIPPPLTPAHLEWFQSRARRPT